MEHEQQQPSAFGALGRRLVAWVILIAIAIIALKVLFGIVAGIVSTLLWMAALAALVVAALWAVKRA